jgi:hypothetical protein
MPAEEMTQDVVKMLQELKDQQSSGDEDVIWQALQQYLMQLDVYERRQGTSSGATAAKKQSASQADVVVVAAAVQAKCAESSQGGSRECAEPLCIPESHSSPGYRYDLECIAEEPELETSPEEADRALGPVRHFNMTSFRSDKDTEEEDDLESESPEKQNHALGEARYFNMMSFKSVRDTEEDDAEPESPEKPSQARHFAMMSFKSVKDAEEDDEESESPEKPSQARHFAIMSFKSVKDIEEDDAESESPENPSQARYFTMMSFKSVRDIDDDDAASESDGDASYDFEAALSKSICATHTFDSRTASTSAETSYLYNSFGSMDSYAGMHDFELAFEKFSKPEKRAASYMLAKFKRYLVAGVEQAADSRGNSGDEVDVMAMAIM